jgi:RNA methyltransferase, TrmH family
MKQITITARSNPWVQQWLRYHSKPTERKAAGLVWLEGEHLLIEALNRLASKRYEIETLVVPDTEHGHTIQQRLSSQYAATSGLKIVWLGQSVYSALCTLDSVPAVCAVLRLKTSVGIDFSVPTVVLDGVQDPGNVGAVLRLCAAFAVPQLLLSAGCASAWSAKALRAGQGAQLAVQVCEDVDLNHAYSGFTRLKTPIAATSLAEGSTPLNQALLQRQMVWVFGHEGQGISAASQAAATQLLHIPMQGGFESLNVAAAAAICLWQWQHRAQ